METLLFILENGGSLRDQGFICFSKINKNLVIGNILMAIVWSGKDLLLKKMIPSLKNTIEIKS